MLLKILLALAAVFAFLWTIKTRKTFPAFLSIGMITGIIITFFQVQTVQFPGIHIYMGFVALAFIYGLTVKDKDLKSRIIICLMSASIFTYWLWVLNHWHGNEMLAPIVVLVAGTTAIITKAKLNNEAGFLVILAVDAVAIVLERLMELT